MPYYDKLLFLLTWPISIIVAYKISMYLLYRFNDQVLDSEGEHTPE